MSKIKVHAGDFLKEDGFVSWGVTITLKTKEHSWAGENIPLTDIKTIEVASEDSVKRAGGTVGWGLVGVAVLGPVGLLAGLLLGGRGKDVTFVLEFKDGRKLLGTTDSKTYTKLVAAAF